MSLYLIESIAFGLLWAVIGWTATKIIERSGPHV